MDAVRRVTIVQFKNGNHTFVSDIIPQLDSTDPFLYFRDIAINGTTAIHKDSILSYTTKEISEEAYQGLSNHIINEFKHTQKLMADGDL